MKKVALASAILASLAAGTVNAATVYQDDDKSLSIGGRAEARFNLSDANKGDDGTGNAFKDKSRARINLKGKAKINDQVTAFGKYEAEISDSSDSTVKSRYVFAGFDTQAGAFSYGKQDSAQVMLTDYTDILATFGGDGVDLVDGNKDKRENNFLYAGEFNNFTVSANYIAENNDAVKDSDSYGIAAQYAFPFGLSLGAGYVSGQDGVDVDANQYNLAASYEFNNFYAAATYASGEDGNTDLTGYELATAFKMNQFIAQAAYNFKQSEDGGVKTDKVDYFVLEGIYKFNKNLRTYAGYLFNQIDGEDDELQMGIRYDF
ncbi:porin [Photobacterium angustum]|uniref:OmpU-like outer membrane protein n=1 Tax=Photobacterium angustum (strain S14 / CCUG 15956) TaxID=314292 RepID=Q1ZQR6_PHOAS|nr:porin [Photobacterium angustum]EAS64231.1 OmpU-like outer membrane protein [Photobacterium angustum S14]KJF94499.1 membrane protein [Photobacterium angustum]KJG05670.1 membrane protein [Photobacterium angustum]PSV91152.1 porin [Photobacterium angustum]PSW79031.1 porin [Photobacterium angustum]